MVRTQHLLVKGLSSALHRTKWQRHMARACEAKSSNHCPSISRLITPFGWNGLLHVVSEVDTKS